MNNIGIAIAALKQKRDFHQSQVDNLNSAITMLAPAKRHRAKAKSGKKVDYAARVAKRKATLAKKKVAGASLAEAAAS